MITDRQFAAARRHAWLRAVYFHDDMVQRILTDPDVAADTNITPTAGTPDRDINGPDAKLGGELSMDVVPDTPVSRQAHTGRSGIDSRQQLLTYPPATQELLHDIFDTENSRS